MNAVISRSALIAEYDRVHIGEPGGARKLMEDAPAVDAVKVIYCKDCQHRVKANLHGGYRCMHPTAGMTFVAKLKDDDHCSYGERKNESETL